LDQGTGRLFDILYILRYDASFILEQTGAINEISIAKAGDSASKMIVNSLSEIPYSNVCTCSYSYLLFCNSPLWVSIVAPDWGRIR